jgi:hypothetical protein
LVLTPDNYDAVNSYVSHALSLAKAADMASTEDRVDLSHIVPGLFGTCDFWTVRQHHLTVVDFKFGMRPVAAQGNYQLQAYALGLLPTLAMLGFDVTDVTGVIYQPRLAAVRGGPASVEASYTLSELNYLADQLRHVWRLIQSSNAPRLPGPSQCEWCPAVSSCRAAAEHALAQVRAELDTDPETYQGPDPESLTLEDSARLVSLSPLIAKVLAAHNDRVYDAVVVRGVALPGWKAVAGRNLPRRYSDEEAAEKAMLAAGLSEQEVHPPGPLVSPSKLEKTNPGVYAAVKAVVVSPPGKPLLAPDWDPRPAISPTAETVEKELA